VGGTREHAGQDVDHDRQAVAFVAALLACPAERCRVASATGGSVVGCPAGSSAQSRGMGFAQREATWSFPIATVLVAMSNTKGCSRPAGAARDRGFVPSIARRPNVGTVAGPGALVIDRPIMSWARAIIE
jgi:hypothetical protein